MNEQNITNDLFRSLSERYEDTRSEAELFMALSQKLHALPAAPRAKETHYADYQHHSGHYLRLPYAEHIEASKEEICAEIIGHLFAFCRANQIDITEYLTLLIQK